MNMTTGAIEYSLTERHFLSMPTCTTCLTGIGWIHGNIQSPSFFRFGVHLTEKGRPCRVSNGFSKAMIVHHPVGVQVLNTNDAEATNYLSRRLMGEVLPFELGPFMHTRDNSTVLAAFGRSLCQLAMLTLYLCQCLLFFTKETGIGYLFTGRQGSERLETNINTNLFGTLWQAFGFGFTRKRDVPLACTTLVNGSGFESAFDGTMIHHFDVSNAKQNDFSTLYLAPIRGLRKGKAIVASIALEAWVSWCLTCFDATKERLQSQFNPFRHVLQDLSVDQLQRGTFRLENRNTLLRLIIRDVALFLFPCILAVSQCLIIEPAAFFKLLLKNMRLFFCWVQTVLKRLSQSREYTVILGKSQVLPRELREPSVSPYMEDRGPIWFSQTLS